MKEEIMKIVLFLIIIVGIVFAIVKAEINFNKTTHEDDIQMTEWISPDGVHYWYQQAGYHAVLAPRYDADGNLVID